MDGPYDVHIEVGAAGVLTVRGRTRPLGVNARTGERASATETLDALAADSLSAAERIVQACPQAGDTTRDAERLELGLLNLRAELVRRRN